MKSRSVWLAIASCLATLVVVLLAVNLAGGEKQIERKLERSYATEDPQFRHAMSALPLLEAGVQIAEYQPTMFHCKVMVVDGLWVSVGSTNFDNRSFRINDEANLNVLSAAFARQQIDVFEHDLQRSKLVTLQAWQARPWREKLVEQIASLLGSQL